MKTSNPTRLRPLNRPRAVRVQTNEDDEPIAVHLSGRLLAVESALETWRIDDEWWRERPISRLYWRVLLEDGRIIDIFRDRVRDRWARQTY
jgi:hypothetical protein